ncbi:MAG: DUF3488 domain-containing protein [Betaproteobacteria bacterium]|nr:DUF3488 domain-containing protein [Betaproteobacteria bacterium]
MARPAFWDFDGKTWRPGGGRLHPAFRYEAFGNPVDYEVTLEPHNSFWLFGLDLPAHSPPNSRVTSDYQMLAIQPVRARALRAAVLPGVPRHRRQRRRGTACRHAHPRRPQSARARTGPRMARPFRQRRGDPAPGHPVPALGRLRVHAATAAARRQHRR